MQAPRAFARAAHASVSYSQRSNHSTNISQAAVSPSANRIGPDAVSANAPHGYERYAKRGPERTRQVKARDTHGSSHRLERQIFLQMRFHVPERANGDAHGGKDRTLPVGPFDRYCGARHAPHFVCNRREVLRRLVSEGAMVPASWCRAGVRSGVRPTVRFVGRE